MKSEFQTIIERAIRDAEKVPCDFDRFKVGLAEMWHALNDRLDAEGVDPRSGETLGVMEEFEE